MEFAKDSSIKLQGLLARRSLSSKQIIMFNRFKHVPPRNHGGIYTMSSAPDVSSTAHPIKLTRQDTEGLLVKITDDFQAAAAKWLKKSESRTSFGSRSIYARKHEALQHLAACARLTRSYMAEGNDAVLESALNSLTAGCTCAQNQEAADEIERLQEVAFPGVLFGKDQTRNSIILPAGSRHSKPYFRWVENSELYCT